MGVNEALDLGREALWMVLIVSVPVMGAGMLVGLVISFFQSLTQLQEQTLSFVPKIVAMVGIAMILVPWLAGRLLAYAEMLLGEPPF